MSSLILVYYHIFGKVAVDGCRYFFSSRILESSFLFVFEYRKNIKHITTSIYNINITCIYSK